MDDFDSIRDEDIEHEREEDAAYYPTDAELDAEVDAHLEALYEARYDVVDYDPDPYAGTYSEM